MTNKIENITAALESVTETKVLQQTFNTAAQATPHIFAILGPSGHTHACATITAIRKLSAESQPMIITVNFQNNTSTALQLKTRLQNEPLASVLFLNFEKAADSTRRDFIDAVQKLPHNVFIESTADEKTLAALPEMKDASYATFNLQLGAQKNISPARFGNV